MKDIVLSILLVSYAAPAFGSCRDDFVQAVEERQMGEDYRFEHDPSFGVIPRAFQPEVERHGQILGVLLTLRPDMRPWADFFVGFQNWKVDWNRQGFQVNGTWSGTTVRLYKNVPITIKIIFSGSMESRPGEDIYKSDHPTVQLVFIDSGNLQRRTYQALMRDLNVEGRIHPDDIYGPPAFGEKGVVLDLGREGRVLVSDIFSHTSLDLDSL